MLLPNEIKPETSIYYYASLVLKEVRNQKKCDIVVLYQAIKKQSDISLKVFSYCLDWLFLIEAVTVNEDGVVSLCT